MKLDQAMREFIADRYSTSQHQVDYADDINTDDQSVHVFGTMPNTNTVDWFYAGDLSDIQREMEREAQYHKQ